jgi:hypothetical protein
VLDRLHGIDVAVAAGVDPRHPSLNRLRWWAQQSADAHQHGAEFDWEER